MTQREPVVIACATDAHYLKPLAVMLRSVLTNLSPDRTAEIYVMDGGLDARSREKVTRGWPQGRATVHWMTVDPEVYAGAPLWGRMPVSTYYKLAIPDTLPLHVHRAIWLDCDLIVTTDLSSLWDIDLDGNHLRASQDSIVPLVSSSFGVTTHEELGIASDARYFNAGVMLVDVDRWRTDRIPEQVLDYLRRYRDSVFFWDQEGLNAVLANKWGDLDPRWNCNASVPLRRRAQRKSARASEAETGNDQPWIIHWAGYLKPWRYPGRDPEKLLYFRYLDMTAWAGWRPRPNLASRLIERYESSGLRAALYPAEQWGVRLLRRLSRRTVTVHKQTRTAPSPVLAKSVRPADAR
jgi:lipopolysaccharide biosynthesis glycosyltransferase